jgi:hypothetical protein
MPKKIKPLLMKQQKVSFTIKDNLKFGENLDFLVTSIKYNFFTTRPTKL